MKTLFKVLAVCLLLAVGCDVAINYPSQDVKKPIKFDIKQSPASTNFEWGDEAGLYVFDPNNYGNRYITNEKFIYHEHSWSPETDLYWDDKYEVADFVYYFPYIENIHEITRHQFGIDTDQSKYENYKKCDLLWGKATGVSRHDEAAHIELSHLMSRFVITLKAGNGYTEEELYNSEVYVNPDDNICYVNLHNAEITEAGWGGDIRAYYNPDDNKYYAIVVPQNISDKNFIRVVTRGGKTFTMKLNIDLEQGKQHNCTLTLNKNSYGVDIDVSDWEVDNNDYGGELY